MSAGGSPAPRRRGPRLPCALMMSTVCGGRAAPYWVNERSALSTWIRPTAADLAEALSKRGAADAGAGLRPPPRHAQGVAGAAPDGHTSHGR